MACYCLDCYVNTGALVEPFEDGKGPPFCPKCLGEKLVTAGEAQHQASILYQLRQEEIARRAHAEQMRVVLS